MQSTLRAFDLAHLAHLELLTPKPEESLNFFVNVMGMTESGREGDSVYLRGWDDYEFHTLKLTAHSTNGMRHFAFRCTSPEALQRRVKIIEQAGLGVGWTDGDLGHGPAYAFKTSDGHNMELYWETNWYKAPDHLKPSLKNQAMRFPARGANVRRLDHLNLLAADVPALREFFENILGMRVTEKIVLDNGQEAGVWVTATNKTYDVAFTHDHYNVRGRFHHATYALDSREEILRAADIFLENGVHIETGPHKHAVQQTFFLYVYEPGGNRIEVANAGARLMLAPDWQPIIWTEAERKKGQAWGLKTIETFHTHGTPVIDPDAAEIAKDKELAARK
jgi:catechol 2,3-dioxygenase